MASSWIGSCPHCKCGLSYLEGVTGSIMNPKCPRCHEPVEVTRATFLMANYSRPAATVKIPPRRP